jgi:hypothetical protein
MRYAVMHLDEGGATWDDLTGLGQVDKYASRWS